MIQSLGSNNIFNHCKNEARDKLGLDNTESNLKFEKLKKRNFNPIYVGSDYSSNLFIEAFLKQLKHFFILIKKYLYLFRLFNNNNNIDTYITRCLTNNSIKKIISKILYNIILLYLLSKKKNSKYQKQKHKSTKKTNIKITYLNLI